MKKIVLCLLAVPLFLPLSAAGQQQSIKASKPFTIAGRVSEDGKSLIAKNGEPWSVKNPSTLAEHVGQLVKVKCQIASVAREIRVLSVKTMATPTTFHPNPGDSVFRR